MRFRRLRPRGRLIIVAEDEAGQELGRLILSDDLTEAHLLRSSSAGTASALVDEFFAHEGEDLAAEPVASLAGGGFRLGPLRATPPVSEDLRAWARAYFPARGRQVRES